MLTTPVYGPSVQFPPQGLMWFEMLFCSPLLEKRGHLIHLTLISCQLEPVRAIVLWPVLFMRCFHPQKCHSGGDFFVPFCVNACKKILRNQQFQKYLNQPLWNQQPYHSQCHQGHFFFFFFYWCLMWTITEALHLYLLDYMHWVAFRWLADNCTNGEVYRCSY